MMSFVHNLICMSRRPTTPKALSSDFVHKLAHKGTGTRANAHDGMQYRISVLFTSHICGSFLTINDIAGPCNEECKRFRVSL